LGDFQSLVKHWAVKHQSFVLAAFTPDVKAIFGVKLEKKRLQLANRLAQVHIRIQTRRCHLAQHSRSEEHTSELQSLMRMSYAVYCSQHKTHPTKNQTLK